MPMLNKLRLGAASRCKVAGFKSSEYFDACLSGSGTLQVDITTGDAKIEISGASCLMGTMTAADVEMVLSGASRAKLNGTGNNAYLNAWGAARLDLADFLLKDTIVHLKGASEAEVNISGKLDIDLSGGSRLTYSGRASMGDIHVFGTSILSQR
jgi:hypothetical protein